MTLLTFTIYYHCYAIKYIKTSFGKSLYCQKLVYHFPSMSNSNLSIYYQNCGGMRSKLSEFRNNLLCTNYDIVIITETWLMPGIFDSEITDDRYILFRRDRDFSTSDKKDGGGIIVAIKKHIPAIRNTNLEDENVEELFINLQLPKTRIILCVTYIPPATRYGTYETHLQKLQTLYTADSDTKFLIIGDYNIPDLTWIQQTDCDYLKPVDPSTALHSLLIDTLSFMQLQQFNNIYNRNNRMLDLVLSNLNHICTCSEPQMNLTTNPKFHHHPSLHLTIDKVTIPKTIPFQQVPKYNFETCDYTVIRTDLSNINWTNTLKEKNVSDMLDIFYELVYEIIDKRVKLKTSKSKRYPPWFSKALCSSLARKSFVWRKWKTYGNISAYNEFSLLRERCKLLLKQCFQTYVARTENEIPKNTKSFWKYVSSMKKNGSGYPNIMSHNDRSSSNPTEIADMFNDFFASVFEPSPKKLTEHELDNLPTNLCNPILPTITLTESEVNKALLQLDISKGPGPDAIPPKFLKNTASELCEPLCIIFNKSLKEGQFPDRWKQAYVTPLHKGGTRSSVDHYRPISVLSTIPKVFESLVHKHIDAQLRPYINQQQHGFIKERSTVTNLLLYTNFLFESMDQRTQVDVIYTDFQKAFDKVDHDVLLRQLAFNGIKGNLLRWFASYIDNRYQIVIINGFRSKQILVTSGVIQGSILGPLQYSITVNTITKCFHNSQVLMFADDMKIYKAIRSDNDAILLQADLDRFHQFCNEHKLYLAHNKCKVITFTRNHTKIIADYKIGGASLDRVTFIRDLGVIFDEKLIFDKHVDAICTKAYQMLGFILRVGKSFKNPTTLITLYKTLVRSQLEYASVIWNPHYDIYSKKIESIQRKALKSINYKLSQPKMSSATLLLKFKLQPLATRRTITDELTLYNICNNLYNCPDIVRLINFQVPRSAVSRRSCNFFCASFSRTNAGLRAPINRICRKHNEIFLELDIHSKTKSQFKNEVQDLLIRNHPTL